MPLVDDSLGAVSVEEVDRQEQGLGEKCRGRLFFLLLSRRFPLMPSVDRRRGGEDVANTFSRLMESNRKKTLI